MSFVSETMKVIGSGLALVALIAGLWWAVGAMFGVAYLGFKAVTG